MCDESDFENVSLFCSLPNPWTAFSNFVKLFIDSCSQRCATSWCFRYIHLHIILAVFTHCNVVVDVVVVGVLCVLR